MTEKITRSKILIVDDEKINIDILRSILSDYDKVAALNGTQALRLASADSPPDLILLDVMMPEIDGYEVCRRLKADKKTEAIPVIFVTAKAEMSDEIAGFSSGAVDYIIKPVSPPVVLARVNTHLALKSAYRDLEQQYVVASARERYIRSLIDHALDMIIALDNDFHIVEFNQASEKVFGYASAEVKGRPLCALFAHEIKCDLVEGLLASKGVYTGEMEMMRKNGKSFPVYMKFNQLTNLEGQANGAIGNMRDMTSEKLLAKMMLEKRRPFST